jgi:sugar O-acyltransferase (sialic acid O-acetyltransferase NeuD family)
LLELQGRIMKKVVIFGIGDFARVAYVYLMKDSPHEIVGFTVHENYITENKILGLDVIPFERLEKSHPPEKFAMFIAVGYRRVNMARAEIFDICKSKGYELITYINSKTTHWGEIQVGSNCFIFENNVIQPFVKIGNDVIIWSGNHIGHHSQIGDHCFIASHAVISGNVKIGPYCFVGVNATFRDGINVAPKCIIGAGAVILKDTQEQGVYAVKSTERASIVSSRVRMFK